MSVLLVEGNSENATVVRGMLSREVDPGFKVESVVTLREALQHLGRGRPDVVLQDLSLPDSQGMEALRQMHTRTSGKIPIVVLTDLANEAMAMEALRGGAQEYLLKDLLHGKMLSRVIRYAIERKRAEEALHRFEEQSRFILEHLPLCFYRMNVSDVPRMNFISENVRSITGYQLEVLVSDPSFFPGRIHPEDRERVNKASTSLVEGVTQTCEFRWKIADGSYRWFRDVRQLVRSPHNASHEIIGLYEDITEHRRTEDRLKEEKEQSIRLARELQQAVQELKEAQAEMVRREKDLATGDLAAAIAHEIRNPLSIISMSVQYLESKFDARNPLREFTEAIVQKVQRLDSITRRLLCYGRQRPLNLVRRNLNRCLDQAVSLIKAKCGVQRITLVRQYSRQLPAVLVDEEMMDEVFTNLLTNALQAMPAGGTLSLETFFDPGPKEIRIHVKDTGKGISRRNRQRLFTMFFSTKKAEGGFGLGLVICQRIVSKHDGSLSVDSHVAGKHRGTTFTIRLPLQGPAQLKV